MEKTTMHFFFDPIVNNHGAPKVLAMIILALTFSFIAGNIYIAYKKVSKLLAEQHKHNMGVVKERAKNIYERDKEKYSSKKKSTSSKKDSEDKEKDNKDSKKKTKETEREKEKRIENRNKKIEQTILICVVQCIVIFAVGVLLESILGFATDAYSSGYSETYSLEY